QALMNESSDHIYFKDRESKFIRTSKSQADLFGLADPAQLIGKSDSDYFAGDHARQAYEDEQSIIRTGRRVIKEEKETRVGLPAIWVLTEKMPLYDNNANIIGTFGISRDITERKDMEERLRESEIKYREAYNGSKIHEEEILSLLRQKEILVKEVHHRIKNNMNTICSLLSLQTSTMTDSIAIQALEDAVS